MSSGLMLAASFHAAHGLLTVAAMPHHPRCTEQLIGGSRFPGYVGLTHPTQESDLMTTESSTPSSSMALAVADTLSAIIASMPEAQRRQIDTHLTRTRRRGQDVTYDGMIDHMIRACLGRS